MSNKTMPSGGPIRIAIVGAGIAGLTLSQAITTMDKEHKFDVKIYESAKQIESLGFGIGMWWRSMEIMKAIGLEDRLTKIVNPNDLSDSIRTVFQFRKGDQQEGMHVLDMRRKGGNVCFLRNELQDALASHLTHELHLSHRLASYEELEDEILLQFENGTTVSCDFLVGADGINSHVRKCFLEKQGLSHSPSMCPIWTGDYAYRGVISGELLQSTFPGHRACNTPTLYFGKNRQIVVYRTCHENLIGVAAILSDPSKEGITLEGPTSVECSQDEVLSVFQGWEPEALAVLKKRYIQCLHNPIKWAIQILPPLHCHATGPVALIGDSAHAMPPYQGSGAGQAVEDSYILSSLLTSPYCTKSTLPNVSEVYDAIRRVQANEIADLSRIAGKFIRLCAPGFEDVVAGQTDIPLERLLAMLDTIRKRWEPILKEGFEDCRRRALQMLADSARNSLACRDITESLL